MDDTARRLKLCADALAELEALIPLPHGVPRRAELIRAMVGSIAYHAPHGGIADLARKLRREASDPDSSKLSTYLGHLRASLEATKHEIDGGGSDPKQTAA